MTVYVVAGLPRYESGEIYGVYSTRENAEASWEYRNFKDFYTEIFEYELDHDEEANNPDIDRRPKEGPKTLVEHTLPHYTNSAVLGLLITPTVWSPPGETVQFFRYDIKQETE